ncbi:type II toxin-antitoxin system MqsR family toxin [bacterium]|nr:type II toxin-antitoxin system MqsR family toxin [bacterium]QQR59845.1 MAG: type II toxin-antitoxin system MqsR family toxin [Candidatus Melainabacteria bacterium]
MEKKSPHYLLSDVKALAQKDRVHASHAALKSAAILGFSLADMKYVILNLETNDFYKSMTSYRDSKLWQDVYRFPAIDVDIYLKIQILENLVIISFKEV